MIGNHELYGDQGLVFYHEIFGPDYYSFQLNNNYFIVVDDAAKEGLSQEQLSWLEDGTAEIPGRQDPAGFFAHTPL